MLKKIMTSMAMVVALVASASAFAADSSVDASDPYKLLTSVAKNTVSELKQIKSDGTEEGQREAIKKVVEKELMPHIDYVYAAYSVLGPHLRGTTKEQRDNFANAFRDYLQATLTQVFTKYNPSSQSVNIKDPGEVSGRVVTIHTDFIEEGRPPVRVDFKLRHNKKNDTWGVYDFVAEGISMLSSKQSELGGLVRRKGIDAVTQQLEEKVKSGVDLDQELPGKEGNKK